MNWLKKKLGIDQIEYKTNEIQISISETNKSIEHLKKKEIEKQTLSIPEKFELKSDILEKEVFKFEIIETNNLNNLKIISKRPNKILTSIANLYSFTPSVLLAKSFRFSFPKGIKGDIMNIGKGQGTAITNNGKIIAHGTYLKNISFAAPLIVTNAINVIVKQHHLSEINKSLKNINQNLSEILEIEFIKKEAEIEGIISFYKRAYSDYELIKENDNYRNAILTNIIRENIKIPQLFHFYKKTLKSENINVNSLKYFTLLRKLFIFGKLIEFKYANEYNPEIIDKVKNDLTSMQLNYDKFFDQYSENIIKISEKIDFGLLDNKLIFGDLVGKRKEKKEEIKKLNKNTLYIKNMQIEGNKVYFENILLLKNLKEKIIKPQEYLIDKGNLYEI